MIFKNLVSLISGIDQGDFDLKSEVNKDESMLKRSIIELVKRDLELRPFILFMGKYDDHLVE